jgi:hypothetical protein
LALKDQSTIDSRFYLHVDALDEYEGDHEEIIDIFQELSQSRMIKICLSSRPWNLFEDAFGQVPAHGIRLHELTKRDIELFAYESILNNKLRLAQGRDRQYYKDIIEEISKRAQGVFLWVRLVVRSLRDGLRNDDPISLLRKRLEALPTDLEGFFEHIFRSVDEVYQESMACTFLVAMTAPKPLRLILYSFLDEEDSQYGFQWPCSIMDRDEIQERVSQTYRRLNGRYKGLLEPSQSGESLQHTDTVDFLHRTLHDFLSTPRMQKVLFVHVPSDFDPHIAVSQALLAEAKLVSSPRLASAFRPVLNQVAKSVPISLRSRHECEYVFLDHIECIVEAYSGDSSVHLLNKAMHYGRLDYLEYRLSKECSQGDLDALLMHSISCSGDWKEYVDKDLEAGMFWLDSKCSYEGKGQVTPYPPLVKLLLKKGANPAGTVNGTSIWRHFLQLFLFSPASFRQCSKLGHGGWQATFEQFLDHGADVHGLVELWIEFLDLWSTKMNSADCNYLHVFNCLVKHGLKPHDHCKGVSIWRALLVAMKGSPTAGQSSLARLFLEHKASIDTIFQVEDELRGSIANALGPDFLRHGYISWMLTNLRSDHIFEQYPELEFMFQNGLDANRFLGDKSLWTGILEAIQIVLARKSTTADQIQAFQDVVILCLQYGADPHQPALADLLGWNISAERPFPYPGAQVIQEVVVNAMQCLDSRDTWYEPNYSTSHTPTSGPGYLSPRSHFSGGYGVQESYQIFRGFNPEWSRSRPRTPVSAPPLSVPEPREQN